MTNFGERLNMQGRDILLQVRQEAQKQLDRGLHVGRVETVDTDTICCFQSNNSLYSIDSRRNTGIVCTHNRNKNRFKSGSCNNFQCPERA